MGDVKILLGLLRLSNFNKNLYIKRVMRREGSNSKGK